MVKRQVSCTTQLESNWESAGPRQLQWTNSVRLKWQEPCPSNKLSRLVVHKPESQTRVVDMVGEKGACL